MTRCRNSKLAIVDFVARRTRVSLKRPFLFVAVYAATAVPQNAIALNLDQAKPDWATRESDTRTASFTFVSKRFIPIGSSYMPGHGSKALGGRARAMKTNPDHPESDLTLTEEYVVKFDGNKVRVQRVAPPILESGDVSFNEKATGLATFDGVETMKLNTTTVIDTPPNGIILERPESPMAAFNLYRPLLWHYRITQTELGGSLGADELMDTGDTGTIDGRQCVIFQQQGRRIQQYWVELGQKSCLRRYIWLNSDRTPQMSIDISYSNDSEHGPIPEKWMIRQYEEDSQIAQQEEVLVRTSELNANIDSSEFRIEFPVGTMVQDERARNHYIVRAGGAKRLITMQELTSRISYEQLRDSEPGAAFLPRRSTFAIVMLVLTTIVVLVLIWLSIRKRMKLYQ
jgi:hypothetical protein